MLGTEFTTSRGTRTLERQEGVGTMREAATKSKGRQGDNIST